MPVLYACPCGKTLDIEPRRILDCCLRTAGYTPWKRYKAHDLHGKLLGVALSERYQQGQCGAQALHCPYYVPLEGRLGADWGVIVNPESSRFGLLTFEHDDCGCPVSPDEDDEGWGRHQGAIDQEDDTWCADYRHEHTEWCGYAEGECPLAFEADTGNQGVR